MVVCRRNGGACQSHGVFGSQLGCSHIVARQSSGPKADEWEVHRELITKLYMNDSLSLKSVTEYMISHHGFNATYVPRPSVARYPLFKAKAFALITFVYMFLVVGCIEPDSVSGVWSRT
jgi:hypothetical protein